MLDVPSGSTFTVAENTPDRVLANVSSNNGLADITTGKKAARIYFTLAPDAPLPFATMLFGAVPLLMGRARRNRPGQHHVGGRA